MVMLFGPLSTARSRSARLQSARTSDLTGWSSTSPGCAPRPSLTTRLRNTTRSSSTKSPFTNPSNSAAAPNVS